MDDCNLVQSGTDPVEVLSSIQSLINSWGSLMQIICGALSIDKSWWYLIEYVCKRGKWVASDTNLEVDLVVVSSTGEFLSLKILQANESFKML